MSNTIKYIASEDGMIQTFSEEVDGAELIQAYKDRFSNDNTLKKLRYIISDFTSVTNTNVTAEDIRSISRIANEASKTNNTLFLVGIQPTELMRGMARMWQAYSNDDETGWHTITLRSRKEGEEWY